ncbi:MAG: redoxin domain-containing protein [Bacteroidales bacterium]|nr:redoxin domain-containing protein [Bacteroidales bacterium]
MHIRIISLISLFCLLSILVDAQNLRISLKGDSTIVGKKIRLSIFEDNISYLEKEIDSLTIEDSVSYFNETIEETSLMSIKIDAFSYNFLAKKGATYSMRILPFNFSISDSVNTLFYKIPLPIVIEENSDNNLNSNIFIIDSIIEDRVVRLKNIRGLRNRKAIDSLKAEVFAFANKIEDSYIKDYAIYSIGQMEYFSNGENEKQLKKELFYNKPILYHNLAYMDCFEAIFGSYFSMGNRAISHYYLDNLLVETNYFALIDSLGRDTILRNEVFRELVFLRGMKELYANSLYEPMYIDAMLEKFIYQTKFSEHRKIAKNLLYFYSQRRHFGIKASEFSLKDIYNNYITLDKYKGKKLILSFVKLKEPSSLRELNMLYSIKDSLQNDIEFLTISCDNTLDALYNFLVNSKVGTRYKWDFAYFDNKWEILKKYNVIVFPTFLIIDEKGNIISNPIRKPSEGSLLPFVEKKHINLQTK